MAAIATSLVVFADNGNQRTFVTDAHSAIKPALVIQKRSLATTPNASAEDKISVVYGTVDADGAPLAARVAFEVNVKRPNNGNSADVTAALAVFRDIVASDEFGVMISKQFFIKN